LRRRDCKKEKRKGKKKGPALSISKVKPQGNGAGVLVARDLAMKAARIGTTVRE